MEIKRKRRARKTKMMAKLARFNIIGFLHGKPELHGKSNSFLVLMKIL